MRVNVWIRQEDEKAWQEIANKSAWIHSMLSTSEKGAPMPTAKVVTLKVCKHLNINKRWRVCSDCGEPV